MFLSAATVVACYNNFTEEEGVTSLQCKPEGSKVTKEHAAASLSVFRIKCGIKVIRTKVLSTLAPGDTVSQCVRAASTQSWLTTLFF